MPTVGELNAAFDAVSKELPNLVNTLAPDTNIPFVGNIRQILLGKLKEPAARPVLLKLVRVGVEAAEEERAKGAK